MEKIFSTRDINLAASLISHNFPLVGIDYQIEGVKNAPVGYFKFDNTQELLDSKTKYMQGSLLVEPKTFMLNIKMLKSEISNIYKNPHVNIG